MTYRLIAVDLDDSLLGSDSKISRLINRLFSARDKGVYVTINWRDVGLAMPYIRVKY